MALYKLQSMWPEKPHDHFQLSSIPARVLVGSIFDYFQLLEQRILTELSFIFGHFCLELTKPCQLYGNSSYKFIFILCVESHFVRLIDWNIQTMHSLHNFRTFTQYRDFSFDSYGLLLDVLNKKLPNPDCDPF